MELNSEKSKFVISLREDVIHFCRNSLFLDAEFIRLEEQKDYLYALTRKLKQQTELLVLDASVFFNENEVDVFFSRLPELPERTVAVIPFDSNQAVVRKLRSRGIKSVYIPCEEEFANSCLSVLSENFSEKNRKEKLFYNSYPGVSKEAVHIRREVEKAAGLDVNILFLGETGTGKTYLAEEIHRHSARKLKKFVRVNMPSIVDTLAESQLFGTVSGAYTGAVSSRGFLLEADGGTAFLDEISEIRTELQAKLLRVLDNNTFFKIGSSIEQKVDVRYISASNADIYSLVSSGAFRKDLLYRIGERVISLPPLRKRVEDIPEIAASILRELNSEGNVFDDDAMEFLQGFRWPGNVRQLKSCLKQLAVSGSDKIIRAGELKKLAYQFH